VCIIFSAPVALQFLSFLLSIIISMIGNRYTLFYLLQSSLLQITLWTSYSSFFLFLITSSLPQLTTASQNKPFTTISSFKNSVLHSKLSDDVIISQQQHRHQHSSHKHQGHAQDNHHQEEEQDLSLHLYPTITEKSRTISNICLTGTLCSLSKSDEIEGSPYGSSVDFITDEKGWPVLLLSDLSEHAQNIQSHPQVSLSCQLPTSQYYGEQPSDLGQVTIVGEMIPILSRREKIILQHAFPLAHPHAEPFIHSSKHSFQKIKPLKIRYTGGYGVVSSWINLTEYEEATPDSLAAHMPKLLPRLNLEKETELKLVCKHFLLLDDPIASVKIQSMDRLGFDLRVKIGMSPLPPPPPLSSWVAGKISSMAQQYRVAFRHRVVTIEDAKSELLKLFQECWQKKFKGKHLKDLPVTMKYDPRDAMVS
jgi:hypothetical protein